MGRDKNMQIRVLLLLFFIPLFALNIDVKGLIQYVKTHKYDTKNRLLLAKYYIQKGNYKEAKKYIEKVLKIDKKNKIAKKLKRQIESFFIYKKYLIKNPNNTVSYFYEKGKYKKLLQFFYALNAIKKIDSLTDDSKIKIARVLMWEGKYKDSLFVLSKIKNKKSIDYFEIKAYNLYYLGKYKEAKNYFKLLYYSSFKLDYAKKLIEIYYYLGEYNKAEKLLKQITKYDKKFTQKYSKKIEEAKKRVIKNLEEAYKKDPSYKNLEALAFALFQQNHKKAVLLVQDFINKNPHNDNAKILLAKLLSWSGNNKEALEYLKKLQHTNNPKVKLLLGKILAWEGKYYQATIYLSDVLEHGNKKEKYEAYKMLAYIQMWQGNKKKAKSMFKKVLKENPFDEDAKESLMILNKNIAPLIKKYKKLLKKDPANEEYLLKLADFYYMIKNYQQSAYYYERYLKLHPENAQIYKTLGDIYLELKNYYKGFGNWEYYANYKNTKEAYLELAKRYYWNGFNKEALRVLNQLLNKYPNYKKAAILKAKILKISPNFVTSSTAATIDEYFNNRSKKLLILGDRAYFSNNYATAADYYKMYLSYNPDDYDVHEKYAYTLEYSKQYAKAAGEFYLLMWYKKTPTIEYNYAYSLQKSGKIEEAKKIYKKLLSQMPKPLPNSLKEFLNNWKKAWESMNFREYSKFYGKNYTNNLGWVLRKQALFKNSYFISVGIYDPILLEKRKNVYIVKFYQVFASKRKKDKGYKTLYIKCEKKCKIIRESWEKGKYVPFKKENSLKKYILENLKAIEAKKSKSKKVVSHKNIIKKPLIKKITIKKPPKKIIKPIKTTPKKTQPKKSIVVIKTLKNYFLNFKLNYFKDNQKTDMTTYYLTAGKNIFGLIRGYNLTQNNQNHKSYYYGIGYKNKNFLIDIFYDIEKMVGWDIEYFNKYTFRINKHNLAYSRKSICSIKYNRIKAEISYFNQISPIRDLWYSLAYEYVNNKNNVFTPQFYYDFYESFPFTMFAEGWYQFNSKNSCYYSPKKTDSNFIGIKYQKNYLTLKGAIGYSFFDSKNLYKISAFYKNKIFKTGCSFSNSSNTTNTNDYESIECLLEILKVW